MAEKSSGQSDNPSALVQRNYQLRPRDSDNYRDMHLFDFGPSDNPYGDIHVDLAVAGGPHTPDQLGVHFIARENGSRAILRGEAYPGVTDVEALNVLAAGLAAVFTEFKTIVEANRATPKAEPETPAG